MRMDGLRDRTKQFALRIIRLFVKLPKTTEAQVLGKQLLRSGTSVAAHIREASRGRSTAEFLAKLGVAEQELDESLLWLDLLIEAEIVRADLLADLQREADELLRILVATIKTSKQNS